MHAAEHDELGIRIRGELRQLQRVAGEIGVLEHLIALVMMAEDAKPLAENFLGGNDARSEEHTSELQSLMRISYAVFCLKKKKKKTETRTSTNDYPIIRNTIK